MHTHLYTEYFHLHLYIHTYIYTHITHMRSEIPGAYTRKITVATSGEYFF